jgi:hypothetical protein
MRRGFGLLMKRRPNVPLDSARLFCYKPLFSRGFTIHRAMKRLPTRAANPLKKPNPNRGRNDVGNQDQR